MYATLVLLLVAMAAMARAAVVDHGADPIHMAISLPLGTSERVARQIANEHGMDYYGKIGDLESLHWLGFRAHHVTKRIKRETAFRLQSDDRVEWARELHPLKREKRDFLDIPAEVLAQREKRASKAWADPMFEDQWFMTSGSSGGNTMKVKEAWARGYSGKGVAVSILDDGIQKDHPDLAQNYDQLASTDLNGLDSDPTPRNDGYNSHGTRCASEVASVAGNSVCGVGIAYNASIGGVRMLDGFVSDAVEGGALGLNQNHIHIYSASWGPEDDGRTFDGPGPLAQAAFKRGATKGRGGLGNIYVWASGNGGAKGDSCSFDGYSTSIYTLSIGAATYDNTKPWYLESCPSVVATAYSSGSGSEPAVVAADSPSGCTRQHTGTSAAAPIAAGIIALALQANPKLTWRDVQHIIVRTSNPTPLLKNPGWIVNSVGRKVSPDFGYGLLDAEAIVKMAEVWQTVPEQKSCKVVFGINPAEQEMRERFVHAFALEVGEECASVQYLEHVQVILDIPFAYQRGGVQVTLTSPGGTKSVIMPERPRDTKTTGMTAETTSWPLMSVQQWGENPHGKWTLEVKNAGTPFNRITFAQATLVLYGTQTPVSTPDLNNPLSSPQLANRQSLFQSRLVRRPNQSPQQ